jgi:hypothetical protein
MKSASFAYRLFVRIGATYSIEVVHFTFEDDIIQIKGGVVVAV